MKVKRTVGDACPYRGVQVGWEMKKMLSEEEVKKILERNIELEDQVINLNRRIDCMLGRYEEVCEMAERLCNRLETATKIFRKVRDESGNDEYFRI